MRNLTRTYFTRALVWLLSASLAFTPVAVAQSNAFAPPPPVFTQQELDQMLAPIALYPDALLSQILMASTYPLEVVEAARWSRANPGLNGDQAVRAVERMDWDPSVKSLVAFPQILTMMDEKLTWTQRLGDAFLAQQPQVMDSVQGLRQRAYAAGNLRSTEQVRVVPQARVIVIEQVQPQIVYVPYYNPTVVYGLWWWPAQPPVYWAPWPGYFVRPGPGAGFAWGSGIGISVGFFFGGCDWHQRRVNVVHVNNYYYNKTVIVNHQSNVTNVTRHVNAAPGAWRHDPFHRRGVNYREAAQGREFGRMGASDEARREFRGRDSSLQTVVREQDPRPQARDTHAGRKTQADTRVQTREPNNRRPDMRNEPANHTDARADNRPDARSDLGSRADNRRDARDGARVRPDIARDGNRPDVRSNSGGRPEVRAEPRQDGRDGARSLPNARARDSNRSDARADAPRATARPETAGVASRPHAPDVTSSVVSERRPPVMQGAVQSTDARNNHAPGRSAHQGTAPDHAGSVAPPRSTHQGVAPERAAPPRDTAAVPRAPAADSTPRPARNQPSAQRSPDSQGGNGTSIRSGGPAPC